MAIDEAGEPEDWWDEASSAVAQGTGPAVNDEASRDAGGEQLWCAVDAEDAVDVAGAAGVVGVGDAVYVDVVDAAGDGLVVASPGPGGGDARKRRRRLARCCRWELTTNARC